MVDKFTTAIQSITLGQVTRVCTSMFGAVALIWTFSGPVVKSYAADALLEVLKQQGVDPATIAQIKQQSIQNNLDIQDLNSQSDLIRGDLNSVKQQNAAIAGKIETSQAILEQLLRASLNRTGSNP